MSIAFLLNINSYLKISIIIVLLFIPMELYNEYIYKKQMKNNTNNPNALEPVPNSKPNLIPSQTNKINTIPTQNTMQTQPQSAIQNMQLPNKDLGEIKYSVFKKTDTTTGLEKDSLPLDGLDPQTLVSKLNYIHYATSNPMKPISYVDFKSHADNYLEQDGTKLSTNDSKLLEYTQKFYPQLSALQIDEKDCLNYGSGSESCFQSAQLFYSTATAPTTNSINNNQSILNKGVNQDNANLIIKEDFCNYSIANNSMVLDENNRYKPILFRNAEDSNLDKILDNKSNELMAQSLDNSSAMCRNCKLAVCNNNYCGLQNELFM